MACETFYYFLVVYTESFAEVNCLTWADALKDYIKERVR